jgi:hypothetical protein
VGYLLPPSGLGYETVNPSRRVFIMPPGCYDSTTFSDSPAVRFMEGVALVAEPYTSVTVGRVDLDRGGVVTTSRN